MKKSTGNIAPIIYLPHGAGPMPFLGGKEYGNEHLVPFLKSIASSITEPSAILVISAHWEAQQASLTSAQQPELIYDYSGFPEQAYQLQYPAPGAPALAQEIYEQIKNSGINVKLEAQRGFDHGMFVPLTLVYPKAHIPCIQLSLVKGLDPATHIVLGKALSELRKKNILIIGSGMSFHNMSAFFQQTKDSYQKSEHFDQWLIDSCTDESISKQQKEKRLIEWESAPNARYSHPREEHLLPLHVCFGAAYRDSPNAKVIFNEKFMGVKVTGLIWHE